VKIEIINTVPVNLKTNGHALVTTSSWGFTPLWALVREVYGFEYDDLIKCAIDGMPSNGIKLVEGLSPKLLLVEKTNDPARAAILAKELIKVAVRHGIQSLVIDSFRLVFTKIKSEMLSSVIRSLFETDQKNMMNIFFMVGMKNYHEAAEVLFSINREPLESRNA
jgi:hypothetical protein